MVGLPVGERDSVGDAVPEKLGLGLPLGLPVWDQVGLPLGLQLPEGVGDSL